MTKQKPKVPPSKVPIIGQKSADKEKSEEFVRQIMNYLDPIMNDILQSIDGIERRLAVVEEVKQVFPAKVDVNVKMIEPQEELDVDSLSFEVAVKRAGYKSVADYILKHGYEEKEEK